MTDRFFEGITVLALCVVALIVTGLPLLLQHFGACSHG